MTANPVGFCYSSRTGVLENAAPGWLFVPDQNRDDPAFVQAQAKGAYVCPYLDMVEDAVRGAKDREFRAYAWAHRGGNVELWGNRRKSWYPLVNTRVGSEYVRRTVDYIAQEFMPRFSGITLDVCGGQLHAKADWKSWPPAEQRQWQDGMVDFVRLLDAKRREIKPWFTVQTINIWNEDKRGLQYVDGFCVEMTGLDPQTPGLGPFRQQLVQEPVGYLGQRRLTVIARNEAEALQFAQLPGVTHVTATPTKPFYQAIAPPVVQPQDNRLAEAQAMREWLHTNRSGAEELDHVRAELSELTATFDQQAEQLLEANETKRLLGDRVDLLTTKIKTTAAFVAEQAEGVE